MKKLFSILILITLSLSVVGCGGTSTSSNKDSKIITVGATPVPHEEILEKVKPILEKEGYILKIVEFNDYVTPNTALFRWRIVRC